jgi:hypothetical protein
MGVLEDMRSIVFPQEDIGIGPGTDRSYIPSLGGKISLVPVEETFEQGPYLFEMGCKKVGTGVADGGGGSGKIYTYPFWTTAKPVIQTCTIEAGDDIQKEEMEYGYAETINLSGKGKEACKMSADILGRQVTPGASRTAITIAFVLATKKITDSGSLLAQFATGTTIRVSGSANNDGIYTVATGGVAGEIVVTEALATESVGASVTIEDWYAGGPTGLSVPTVEDVLFGKTKLYLDAAGGTIGSTLISNALLDMAVSFKTGILGQDTASGNLYFSHLEYLPVEITANLTFLFNGNAIVERALMRAQTARQLRIKSEGSALGTPGSVYSYKTRVIDLAGKWDKFNPIGEQGGADVVQATFRARYNATAALFARVVYVNELTSLL